MRLVEGVCTACGKTIRRNSPISIAVTCDCYKYCPLCGKEMQPYQPDLMPSVYGPIQSETATGDTEKPVEILYHCPDCNYHSAQMPVEVELS